jgi:hypothetical protein
MDRWEGGKTLDLSSTADTVTLVDSMDNHEVLNVRDGKVLITLKALLLFLSYQIMN